MAEEAAQQANRSGMDPKRLVVMFYLGLGIVLTLFFGNILAQLFALVGISDFEVGDGLGWTLSALVGGLLALGVVLAGLFHPKLKTLSFEVASELLKVTWPTWAETRVSTVAVVVASVISATLLFGIDSAAYQLMVNWLPRVWGAING